VLITTTGDVQGRNIKEYLSVISGEVIMGTNIFRDLFATFGILLAVGLAPMKKS